MQRSQVARCAAWGVMAALLAGCASAPTEPTPAETVAVPGTAATVIVPENWSWSLQGTQDSDTELIARDKDATGDPGFRANVVVTSQPAERTLDDEGAAALAAADALPGWTPVTLSGGGRTEVGGLPAFRVEGVFDSRGVAALQTETIVEAGTGDSRTFVYVTTSVAPPSGDSAEGDAAARDRAAAAAQSMLDSLTLTP